MEQTNLQTIKDSLQTLDNITYDELVSMVEDEPDLLLRIAVGSSGKWAWAAQNLIGPLALRQASNIWFEKTLIAQVVCLFIYSSGSWVSFEQDVQTVALELDLNAQISPSDKAACWTSLISTVYLCNREIYRKFLPELRQRLSENNYNTVIREIENLTIYDAMTGIM